MGSTRTTKYVLDVLMEREGNPTPIGMLVSRTGLTREQVLSSTTSLVAKNIGVTKVLSGHSWVYKAAGEPTETASKKTAKTPLHVVPKAVEDRSGNRIFTEVGMTSTGEIVIQDTESNLYRAKKL